MGIPGWRLDICLRESEFEFRLWIGLIHGERDLLMLSCEVGLGQELKILKEYVE